MGGPDAVDVYFNRQDPGLLEDDEGDAFPLWRVLRIDGEGPYLDGPVTPRVAVLDIDPSTGALRPGATFRPGPAGGKKAGSYEVPMVFDEDYGEERPDLDSDPYLQVSTFATVMETIKWFEGPGVLGRPVAWAFGAPQLLVVPRAGEMANAFYDRDSHSLQFFSLPSSKEPDRWVRTALSRDVVVHETAHAVLDGVAPDLLGAMTPQARAIHEAVADLAALFASLRDETQLFFELTHWGRDLRGRTAFSRLAEQLGRAALGDLGADALREANNDSTLDADDDTVDALGRRNHIDDVTDVHALSSVLTGAVFRALLGSVQGRTGSGSSDEREERITMTAAGRMASLVFGALDYLPPGELSFADLARAVLVADQVARRETKRERRGLIEELVRRKVVERAEDLATPDDGDGPRLGAGELRTVERDDAAARAFVVANRARLGLPGRGRLTVRARSRAGPGGADLLVKASWPLVEGNDLGPRFPRRRSLVMGATVVIDRASRRVRAVLRGDASVGRQDRQAFLTRLAEEGLLLPPHDAVGPDGVPMSTPMVARSIGGAMVASGGARMLHRWKRWGCLT